MVLWGPAARIALVVCAVFAFLLALGDVLDFYIALWRFTVPATLVYGALIYRFGLATPKGPDAPANGWDPGLVLMKLLMTVAAVGATLGAIALVYDVAGLVVRNWHYVVLAFVIVAGVCLWGLVLGRREARRSAPQVVEGEKQPDTLVS